MSSLRLRIANGICRHVIRRRLMATPDVPTARRDFERAARLFLHPIRGPQLQSSSDHDWLRVKNPRGVILYFHGGAYIAGSPRTHRALAARLAQLSCRDVMLPRYPLAPEHPAPTAFEAAVKAHENLLAQGVEPGQIVLGGDSAGGGIALALLAHLAQTGQPPACLFAFSPWTDLTRSGASINENAKRDRLLDPTRLDEVIGYATGSVFAANDPRLSPLFARFSAPPPVLLSVAETEILRDDTTRLAARLKSAGGEVTVITLPDAPHAWPVMDRFLPEALDTIRMTCAFIESVSPQMS